MRRRIALGLGAALVLLAILLFVWRERALEGGVLAGKEGPAASTADSRARPPGFAPAAPQTPLLALKAKISGRVQDPAGKPLAGALVCARGGGPDLSDDQMRDPTCVSTKADGVYLLAHLYPASWEVDASAAGYRPGRFSEARRESIELRPGQERTGVDLLLRPGGVELRGRVKDLGGGVVSGALVAVMGEEAWAWDAGSAVARADDKGEWRVWVAPGRVTASAQAIGYAKGSKTATAPGSFVEILMTPESVLVGRVVDAATQAPVAGARVEAGNVLDWEAFSALSDWEGRFRIERLEPGRYKPIARTLDRYGRAREGVVLGVGQRSAEVLIEVHPSVTLTGKVLIAGSDRPCPEGWLVLHDRAAQRRIHDSIIGGKVEARALLPGKYEVMVHCADHLPEERYPPLVVSDRPLPPMTWHVRPGLHIAGTLVGPDGAPVREAAIGASVTGGEPRGQRADSWEHVRPDGSFKLTGLLPGDYVLQVVVPDQPEPREPVKVRLPSGQSVEGVRIVLDRAGVVKGTVADEDGKPVAGAEVRASGDRWSWNDGALTRDDGSFSLEGLRPGSYRVVASRPSTWGEDMRAPGSQDDDLHGVKVNVKAGGVVPVKLTVERQSGRITGTVTHGGKPVIDAFVDAQRESESAAADASQARRSLRWDWYREPVLTDTEGRFTLTRLSPGKYLVRAYRKGGGEAMAEHVPVGTEVALVIKPTGALAGTVAVSGQAPPESFRVTVTDDDQGVTVIESFWRTGGQWALRELPAGRFKARAEAREGSAEETVTLVEGQTRGGIHLQLKPRASLRGQVLALDTGKPVPGMRVIGRPPSADTQFYDDDGTAERKNITDAEGRFELENAQPGPLLVYVTPVDHMDSQFGLCLARTTLQPGQQLTLPAIRCARRRVKAARDHGGDLGFTLKDVDPLTAMQSIPLVAAVVRPGGPAAVAGLEVGDVFISIDGVDVRGTNDYLFWTLSQVPEGTTVSLGVARGGTVSVTAGPRP